MLRNHIASTQTSPLNRTEPSDPPFLPLPPNLVDAKINTAKIILDQEEQSHLLEFLKRQGTLLKHSVAKIELCAGKSQSPSWNDLVQYHSDVKNRVSESQEFISAEMEAIRKAIDEIHLKKTSLNTQKPDNLNIESEKEQLNQRILELTAFQSELKELSEKVNLYFEKLSSKIYPSSESRFSKLMNIRSVNIADIALTCTKNLLIKHFPIVGFFCSMMSTAKKIREGKTYTALVELAADAAHHIPGMGLPVSGALNGALYLNDHYSSEDKQKHLEILGENLTFEDACVILGISASETSTLTKEIVKVKCSAQMEITRPDLFEEKGLAISEDAKIFFSDNAEEFAKLINRSRKVIFREKNFGMPGSLDPLKTKEDWIRWFENNPTTTRLELSHRGVDSETLAGLFAALPTSKIKELKLKNCNLADLEAQQLSAILPSSPIQILDLSHNSIGPEGAKALASALPHSKVFRLKLSFNKIGNSGLRALSVVLSASPIHQLCLAFNQIGDSGVSTLASHLFYSLITDLDLSWNSVTNTGVKALAAALIHSPIIKLDLSGNNIGDEGAISLSEVLPQKQLMHLYLGNAHKNTYQPDELLKIAVRGEGLIAGTTELLGLTMPLHDRAINTIFEKGANSLDASINSSHLVHLDLKELREKKLTFTGSPAQLANIGSSILEAINSKLALNKFNQDKLLAACEKKDLDEVKKFLLEGIPAHAQDHEGNTCYHIAVKNNHLTLLTMLFDSRKDLNAKTGDTLNGFTKESAEARPHIMLRNESDQTPLELARELGFQEIIAFLERKLFINLIGNCVDLILSSTVDSAHEVPLKGDAEASNDWILLTQDETIAID